MTASPSQQARVDVLTPLIVERMSVLRRLVEEGPITTDADRARSIPTLLHGNDLMNRIRVELEGMEDEETRLLIEHQDERVGADHVSSIAQLVALPIGVILSLTLVMVVSSRVVRRVRRIEQNALQLEAGEPLTAPDDSKDELGRLSRLMVETGTRLMETQDELRHLATIDPLTGVANRRGFLPLADYQLQVSRREHRPTALAFIDVDGLKSVNDECGHATGDDLLREVGVLLQDTVRASDIVARLGGDEFCVLLTGESGFDPGTAVLRLEHTFAWANRLPARKYPISVSIGLARYEPNGAGDTTDQLIRRADRAMYESKRSKQIKVSLTDAV
jgi:diguanylate cyclase (GGDEF)-like protein